MDGEEKEVISHEIDHVKKFPQGTFALEIEWNNKARFLIGTWKTSNDSMRRASFPLGESLLEVQPFKNPLMS